MTTIDGIASVSARAFTRSCSVGIRIDAPPERIWQLLTDADGFPGWNSTVRSITGRIAPGERLQIRVPYSERTFKVRVSRFEPSHSMIWSDGTAPFFTGVRTYTLTPAGGGTNFAMTEVLSGLMLPLVGRSLPDFKPVFERYASDLVAAAERS